MAREPNPWEWRRALWSPPGQAVAEKTVIISGTTLAFGILLLLGVLFFGAGFPISGLDPHLVAVAFADAFVLIGLVGIAMGVRQHNRVANVPRRRRRSGPR